ncbi:MAG: glycosyltransferase, partial [Terriglobales bacterium]
RPARDARLTVLGEGPLHASLAALAGQLGLAGVVSWRGQVPDPRVFFRRARMLVSASVFGESWGLAMAEAMSCGTPVIATRIGGVEELLGFGRYGTLVASGDPAALADSMAAVWDHPAQARRRAAAARAWVRQFAADRIVPQLEAHYWPVSPLAPAAPVPWLPEFAVSGGPEGGATPHCGMGGAIDVA